VKILALETTDLSGSVAACNGSKLLLQKELNPGQRSAQSLAPAIAELFGQVEWHPSEVRLVAVTVGPGSFTGLRVGVTSAKIFAYAVGAEVLGIDTLETIAANFSPRENSPTNALPDISTLEVVLDAQRGEVVAGTFVRDSEGWFRPSCPQRLLSIDQWLATLQSGQAVAGPILKKLHARLPAGVLAVEERFWRPQASMVGLLAARDYAQGRRDDLWTLLPRYSRRSAAEEKLDQA
jgi:tRNA threonylcarbamoyladenosine biosynthesis protein TsaB